MKILSSERQITSPETARPAVRGADFGRYKTFLVPENKHKTHCSCFNRVIQGVNKL